MLGVRPRTPGPYRSLAPHPVRPDLSQFRLTPLGGRAAPRARQASPSHRWPTLGRRVRSDAESLQGRHHESRATQSDLVSILTSWRSLGRGREFIEVVTRRRSSPSPLRYPGGKASLADFFESAIDALGLSAPTYVEPYAGGAGAGLALLYRGVVGRVVINDYDRSIFAVWDSLLHRTDDCLKRLESTALSVEEWRRQREVYRRRDERDLDPLDLGFATFYLNRTNRSGVLRGGIIGGLKQAGTYKMDARFNKVTRLDHPVGPRRQRRFLYLSRADGAGVRFRRAKLMLDAIPADVLAEADRSHLVGRLALSMPDGSRLCRRPSGRRSSIGRPDRSVR